MTQDPTQPTTPADTTRTLQRAERAFGAGDYRTLRRLLGTLPAESDVARTAQWARAIALDPVQLAVVGACALAWAAIAFRYGAS